MHLEAVPAEPPEKSARNELAGIELKQTKREKEKCAGKQGAKEIEKKMRKEHGRAYLMQPGLVQAFMEEDFLTLWC